jgi:hypothetical protein
LVDLEVRSNWAITDEFSIDLVSIDLAKATRMTYRLQAIDVFIAFLFPFLINF